MRARGACRAAAEAASSKRAQAKAKRTTSAMMPSKFAMVLSETALSAFHAGRQPFEFIFGELLVLVVEWLNAGAR